MPRFSKQLKGFHRQRGAALFVGLMLLLVLTLLGLSSSNASIMQERMAGNLQDRNLAFQRAEGALRDIEMRIRDIATGGGSGNLSAAQLWGQLGLDVGDCSLYNAVESGGAWGGWESAPWVELGSDQEYAVIDLGLGGANFQTSGCIPMMQMNSTPMGQYYMVLARGTGQSESTQVILQTIFYMP